MPVSVTLIRKIAEIDEPKLKDIFMAILEEMERQRAQWEESITRREFLEFGKKMEESFRQVWNSINELAQAQKRTEEELRKLIGEHKKTRSPLGGLTVTLGYLLEDEAFKALPRLLREDYKIEVDGRLKRQYVADKDGRLLEVNIFGHATREGKPVVIIGEGKIRLSKKDINRFIQGKLKKFEGVFNEIFPVMVTYMISSPGVEDYANKKGIALYYSYDF